MDVLYLFSISKNIYYLDFDKDVQEGDEKLVMDVSKVEVDGKEKQFYSFATKFCNRHNPKAYPVYDEEIGKALLHFKKVDSFYDFKDEKLEDYHEFKKILLEFRKHYDLEEIEFKDLEKYLRHIGGML